MKTETTRHYPLPHKDNIASQDVMRIREALEKIDADMTETEQCGVTLKARFDRSEMENMLNLWRSPYESE